MCRWVEAQRVILGHAIHRKRKLEDDLGCHDDDNFEIHTIKSMRTQPEVYASTAWAKRDMTIDYVFMRHDDMKSIETNFKRQASILNAQIHTHSDRALIEFPAQVLQQPNVGMLGLVVGYLLVVGHAPPPQIAAQGLAPNCYHNGACHICKSLIITYW